jgi:hypothetical protein
MNWLNTLERKFGNIAIPHLVRWVVLFNAIGYTLYHINPLFLSFFSLDSSKVMEGEVWRLVTFLFIPPDFDPLWIAFTLYFMFIMGEALEHEWGAFRLNFFYVVGMISTTVIAFFFRPGQIDSTYLNTNLFLAFATLFPEYVIYLFFIIPVKVKWLGILTGVFLFGSILLGSVPTKLAVIISLVNYFIFFGPSIYAEMKLRRKAVRARSRFNTDRSSQKSDSFHLCNVCKRTELDSNELVFRVAADGNEYCFEHLPKKTN